MSLSSVQLMDKLPQTVIFGPQKLLINKYGSNNRVQNNNKEGVQKCKIS